MESPLTGGAILAAQAKTKPAKVILLESTSITVYFFFLKKRDVGYEVKTSSHAKPSAITTLSYRDYRITITS